MSVYTPVGRNALVEFLRNYPVGDLVIHEGISDGIENTNYFVTTERREMVLTLFETHSFEEMGYFLMLMAHMSEHGIPSAHPVADHKGHYLRILNERPAALVERLAGTSLDHPTDRQCTRLGTTLAQMHLAGDSFGGRRANARGHDWRMTTAEKLLGQLPAELADCLRMEMEYQHNNRFNTLPGGTIHADLFRDNALWNGETLTGIIDFYYACDGAWLFDLAVAVNDWCVEADGALISSRFHTLISAYHAVRTITPEECRAWPVVIRAAALRFWLSRLHDWYFPRPGEITHKKDPEVFRRIMARRQSTTDSLPINI